MAFVVIDKRIGQKFFQQDDHGKYVNAPYGTLIDNTLVSRNYDF